MKCSIFISLLVCVLLSSTVSNATELVPYTVEFWEDYSYYVDEARFVEYLDEEEYEALYSVEITSGMDEVDRIRITTFYYGPNEFYAVDWKYWHIPNQKWEDNCDYEDYYTDPQDDRAYYMEHYSTISDWDYEETEWVTVCGYTVASTSTSKKFWIQPRHY